MYVGSGYNYLKICCLGVLGSVGSDDVHIANWGSDHQIDKWGIMPLVPQGHDPPHVILHSYQSDLKFNLFYFLI